MSSKLRINESIVRDLEDALHAARSINTAALTPACLSAVTPYVNEWIVARLERALLNIKAVQIGEQFQAATYSEVRRVPSLDHGEVITEHGVFAQPGDPAVTLVRSELLIGSAPGGHDVTVIGRGNDRFTAECSCGWAGGWVDATQSLAIDDGNSHLAFVRSQLPEEPKHDHVTRILDGDTKSGQPWRSECSCGWEGPGVELRRDAVADAQAHRAEHRQP